MFFSKFKSLLKSKHEILQSCFRRFSATRKRRKNKDFEECLPERNKNKIEGKVALVVGGTSGVGLACVHQLLLNGIKRVMIADSNEIIGKNTVDCLCQDYGAEKLAFIRTDISKPKLVRNIYNSTLQHWEGLDIVVNDIKHKSHSNWSREIDKNVKPIVLNTLIALEYMGTHMGGHGGRIINIVSKFMVKEENLPLFIGAQYFLTGFNTAFSKQCYENTGVRVSCVCPKENEPCDIINLLCEPD